MRIHEDLLYKELCYEIIGCAYDTFKDVGVGFDEVRYHKIFNLYLQNKGLNPKYKVPFQLFYRGECIANFEIDEIVDDKIVVELKCIQTDFIPENYAQMMSYLKATKLRLGLLLNFGLHKAYPKRVIFDEKRTDKYERWDDSFFKNVSIDKLIDSTIEAICQVDNELGAGYHDKIYKSALAIELKQNSIAYNDKVCIAATHNNIQFKPFQIDYWLVHESFLLGVLAGNNKPRTYDLFRMRTYLKNLDLNYGLIAFWSTKNLQIYGISEL